MLWTYNLNYVPEENVTMEMYSFGIAIYQAVLVTLMFKYEYTMTNFSILFLWNAGGCELSHTSPVEILELDFHL